MAAFVRYIGIDYSGAKTPSVRLRGLRVYLAEQDTSPVEVSPPGGKRTNWSRRSLAEWLVELLLEGTPTLVGIDHAFSFPLRYFETHCIKPEWPTFLDDFQKHWPTDDDHVTVDLMRNGAVGAAAARTDPCRYPVAAIYSTTPWFSRPFLAVRWLGYSSWPLCDSRGLPIIVAQQLRV